MKEHKFLIIGCIMMVAGLVMLLGASIAAMVFSWNNPDMTEMRQFLENPGPTIISVLGCAIAYTGCVIVKYDRGSR